MTESPSPTLPAQESALPAPCPFCGGPVSHHYSGSHDWVFECLAPISDCGASITFYISHHGDEPARALAAWNRRATPPIQQGVVEALELAYACLFAPAGYTDEVMRDPQKFAQMLSDSQNKIAAAQVALTAALASLRATSGENGNG